MGQFFSLNHLISFMWMFTLIGNLKVHNKLVIVE